MTNITRRVSSVALFLAISPVFTADFARGADYYCYSGRQVFIQRDPGLVGIELLEPTAPKTSPELLEMPDGIEIKELVVEMPRRGHYICRIADTSQDTGRVDATVSLAKDPRIRAAYPVFRNPKDGSILYAFDEIVVRVRPGTDRRALQRLLDADGVEVINRNRYESDIYVLRVPSVPYKALELANKYARHDLFVWSQPNFGRQMEKLTVNDPLFPQQWHLNNTGQKGLTPDADIDALEAWILTTGSPDVVIAIIDDGVDLTHEDLAANIFINPGESGDGRETNGIDDDGNGYIDDVSGWDFFELDNNADHSIRTGQVEGHGTAVAGLAAAVGNNGVGVAGVAYGSKILPVKVFLGDAFTRDSDAGDAIRYASTLADVLSSSWGGGLRSDAIDDAIAYAVEFGRGGLGCPLFFASGNNSADAVLYPAMDPWTVAVGAATGNDERADFSNYGTRLTVLAPNASWTTDLSGLGAGYDSGDATGNYTGNFGGTSAATPVAAGTAALLLSAYPGLTPIQVQRFLQATTDRINASVADYNVAGFSFEYGYGRINAHNALVQLGMSPLLDDPFEPNNDSTAAAPLGEGLYAAFACLDDDWFAIDIDEFQDVEASIQFLHRHGDLQLEMYNPQGLLADASNGTTNTEKVEARAGENAGRWLLRVFGNAGATNYYHLTINLRPPDDRFEPNDSLEEAAPIDPGNYNNLRGFDPDYYRLRVPSGQQISARINFLNDLGDLDLYLLNGAGDLLDVSFSVNDIEGVTYVNEGADADFILFVDNFNDAENAYQMQVTVGSAQDDAFEENDSPAQAKPIEPGRHENLRYLDPDWYRVDVGAQELIDVEIRFSHVFGDLDLEIFDESLNLVDDSLGIADSERVVFFNSLRSPVQALVSVFSDQDSKPSYSLLIERRVLVDDSFEENDTFGEKTGVGAATYGDLAAFDTDFYGIEANAGDTVAAMIFAEDSLDPLTLIGRSPTGIELGAVAPGDPPVLVLRDVPATGTYGLEVGLRDGGFAGLYAMSPFAYRNASPPPSGDDRFEPNESRTLGAPLLNAGAYPDLWCANFDFFRINLRENDALYVAIAFNHSQADLDMVLYDDYGQILAQSAGTDNSEFCALERAPRFGSYYIRVYPYSTGRTRYDLLIGHRLGAPGDFPKTTATRHWQLY